MTSIPYRNSLCQILLIVPLLCCNSGCLRALGLSHSSLSPRTAALTQQSSIVRSQDGFEFPAAGDDKPSEDREPSADLRVPTSSGGHSIQTDSSATDLRGTQPPTVRLGRPVFGNATANVRPAEPAMPTTSETPSSDTQTEAPASNTTALSVDAIRALMNQRSSNDMSEGRVLQDARLHWNELPVEGRPEQAREEVASPLLQHSVADSPAANDDDQQGTPATDSTNPFQPAARSQALDGNIDPVTEPSMLDRLRGIYGPSEDAGRRARWRLPSPWSVFRDKDTPETSDDEPQTVVVPDPVMPLPTQTVPDGDSERTRILAQLIDAMNKELQGWPRQPSGIPVNNDQFLRREQDLRLLYLIAEQPGPALANINGLPAAEQAFWQDVMLGLMQYRGTENDASRELRMTQTMGQLRSAAHHLTPVSELRISRMDICSEIYSFGRIEPFPSAYFDAGDPILLYVELRNFATRTNSAGTYETNFDAQLQFLSEGNDEPIETVDLPNIVDASTSERRDYFQSFELNLPSHVEAGKYRIHLQIWDRNSNRSAEESIEFKIR